MKNFFDQQNELTAAKIEIFSEYITGYLPKILLTFNCCQLFDLFCGAGKNGTHLGSPLILIEKSKDILKIPQVIAKKSRIDLFFNDQSTENIKNLKDNLQDFNHQFIKVIEIRNDEFQEAFKAMLQQQKKQCAKFFFLDPFNYSDVTVENLKTLMQLDHTEVFLFIPVFHGYRFSSKKDYPKDHKTRKFIEDFTDKGLSNYSGINEFMESIKNKLISEIGLDYVRPILLDNGKCKNAIFLLTKHPQGMQLMNRIAFKKSDDGTGINIKKSNSGQADIFGTDGTIRFQIYSDKLENEIRKNKKMTNQQIVLFTIKEEFLPKHSKSALHEICKRGKIIAKSESIDVTNKPGKWYISESTINTSKTVEFIYVD